ncbi:hypothetical protein RDI58_028938 [Solanum bulbocastanum]|uniref:Uncharacterized protein n=1 Tax=Solanum bulbocastanum TaxID=147425 RepID=A0AAN8SSU2_SOLBU
MPTLLGQLEPDAEDEKEIKRHQEKDAKALLFIQLAVHEAIFSRIAAANNSRDVWMILKIEFQGSSKVLCSLMSHRSISQ